MIKFENPIIINPPPFSDNSGNIVQPNPLTINELKLIFIDNTVNKTLSVQILGIPTPVTLWSGVDYDNIGDWTKDQAKEKLLTILGDDIATKLRSLFPKTMEESPHSPGTVLSKMIKTIGIGMTDSCACKRHALEMNEKGNDWCEQNIDTIVGWLRDEAKRRNLPFIDAIGKLMVNRAIKKSRKLLANEPVPANDEELDNQ